MPSVTRFYACNVKQRETFSVSCIAKMVNKVTHLTMHAPLMIADIILGYKMTLYASVWQSMPVG